MEAERKAAIGRAAERLAENEQWLAVPRRRHLEDVERGVDGRVDERHERGAADPRQLFHLATRVVVGELGDEHGQEGIELRHRVSLSGA